ncbi:MAG: exosortase/archaeosortase family protein [Desulfoprunum sp.]
MTKNNIISDSRGRFLLLCLILFCLGITLYRPALLDLSLAVLHREGSSHGVFVPFLSAYLLWRNFDKIKNLPSQRNWPAGVVVILLGGVLFFLSKYTEDPVGLAVLSFLIISGGLTLSLFGSALFKETAFPLFFLASMIPLPPTIYSALSEQIRLSSTWGSVLLTKSLGVPIYRENFNIYLSGANLFVAESCSGIRYLLSYFVFSLVYAALFKQSLAGRLTVILGSIPLAIAAGMIRLAAIFLAVHYISPAMGGQRPHIFISWTVFAVLLLGIMALDQYLSKAHESSIHDIQ